MRRTTPLALTLYLLGTPASAESLDQFSIQFAQALQTCRQVVEQDAALPPTPEAEIAAADQAILAAEGKRGRFPGASFQVHYSTASPFYISLTRWTDDKDQDRLICDIHLKARLMPASAPMQAAVLRVFQDRRRQLVTTGAYRTDPGAVEIPPIIQR